MKIPKSLKSLTGFAILVVFVFCVYRFYQVSPKLLEPEGWTRLTRATSAGEAPVPSEPPAPSEEAVSGPDVTASTAPVETAPTATPDPAPTPDVDSPAARAAALGLPAPPEIDVESWEFILANEYNPIGEYAPQNPVTVEGQQFDERIVDALQAMVADTRAQNLSVYLSSGYRSYADQLYLYNKKKAEYPPEGKDSAGRWIVMPPGTSEHQTGLCCDITYIYVSPKDESLENTPMFQYMSQHCQDFGFIVRYPKDKQNVTGVMYEPWHFRYVGVDAAQYIMANHLCLEEFIGLYRDVNTAS